MSDLKISQLTNYTTPLNADLTVMVDTANTTTKKTTWQNIKATLKTYFDTLYPSGSGTSTGANTGDQVLPVKASGAELDTGTDDAKFATAKALKDSHNVPSVVPSTLGNVLTSNGTDWVSSVPSAGAPNSKNALATKDVADASGSQTIAHGLGRVPTSVNFDYFFGASAVSVIVHGSYDGATNICAGHVHGTASGTFASFSSASFGAALASTADSPVTAGQTGVITVNATNITIAWTKNGSPTGTVTFMWSVR